MKNERVGHSIFTKMGSFFNLDFLGKLMYIGYGAVHKMQ